jgi:hypothetical protein
MRNKSHKQIIFGDNYSTPDFFWDLQQLVRMLKHQYLIPLFWSVCGFRDRSCSKQQISPRKPESVNWCGLGGESPEWAQSVRVSILFLGLCQFGTWSDVPQFHCAVCGSRSQKRALPAVWETPDTWIMAHERSDAASSWEVPHHYSAIFITGSHISPIWRHRQW